MTLKVNLTNVLFLDIECVPQQPSFYDLDDGLKMLWEKKAKRVWEYMAGEWEEPMSPAELYDNRSGIFAEFGKIIVISVGYFAKTPEWDRQFRLKSFSGDNEAMLLADFFELLNAHYNKSFHQLCGHNIREFDIPYICRRALVNRLQIPTILDLQDKKPWEINHLDTLELWKFGDRKNFISLDLLSRVMGIPSPKTDISGEQVARAYHDDKELPRITAYCERDVKAVAQILLKFIGEDAQGYSVE
jgi:DNA polymerase elongation subunit (family B)